MELINSLPSLRETCTVVLTLTQKDKLITALLINTILSHRGNVITKKSLMWMHEKSVLINSSCILSVGPLTEL